MLAAISVLGPGVAYASGTGTQLSISPTQSSIQVGGGANTTTVTVTVLDGSNAPVQGDTINLGSSDAGQNLSPSSGTTDINGQFQATVTSSDVAGPTTITATDPTSGGLSNTTIITQTPGPAQNVVVSFSPASSITADSASTTTATANVADQFGNVISGDPVTLSTNGSQTFSTDGGTTFNTTASGNTDSSGNFSALVKSSTTAGSFHITGTDTNTNANGFGVLTQVAGPPLVTVSPLSSITADGSSTTTVRVNVADAHGNAYPGDTVTLSSNGGQGFSPPSGPTDGAGNFQATVTSTTTAGSYTITATEGSGTQASGQTTLVQTPGPAATVNVTFSPSPSLTADGTSTTTVTAHVTDAPGNAISGDPVTLTTDGAQTFSTDGGSSYGASASGSTDSSGNFRAILRTSTVAGAFHITGTDTTNNTRGTVVLTQVHGPAHGVTVSLSPPILAADGVSTSTATATVGDAHGNPIAGDHLQLTASDRGVQIGRITDHGNGTYSAVLTSSTMPKQVSVLATDTSVNPAVTGEATLFESSAKSLVDVATMQWSFFFSPGYTRVLSLMVNGAPVGSEIVMKCTGRGCPFRSWFEAILGHAACKRHKHHRCLPAGTYDLTAPLHGKHLHPGAHLVVEVTRLGWIGKYYSFTVRRGKAPKVKISCLAPQGATPGLGCS